MEKICETCKKKFFTKNKYAKYCSIECKTIIKICEYCDSEYKTHRTEQKFCSIECRNKGLGANEEFKIKRSNYMKSKWADVDYRKQMIDNSNTYWADISNKERMSANTTERWRNEEYRKKMSKRMKDLWATDEYRSKTTEKIKEGTNSKECIKKHIKIATEFWTDEKRKIFGKCIKEKWKDEEYRAKQVAERIERWRNKKYRDAHSEKMIEKWKDEEYAAKHFRASTKNKEYILPSGKVIKLQGHEPAVLDALLNEYSEDDIICETIEINNTFGKILYKENGVEHRYYPDFYIKSTNTIIEVKSQWTFDKWIKRNKLKKQACLDAGYNFEFKIVK